jgi:hypothetical protein
LDRRRRQTKIIDSGALYFRISITCNRGLSELLRAYIFLNLTTACNFYLPASSPFRTCPISEPKNFNLQSLNYQKPHYNLQILFLAYYYNRRIQRRRDSFHLSTRYQFRENIQILRSLLPPISFFMMSDVAGLACIWYALIWERSDHNIRLVLQVSM